MSASRTFRRVSVADAVLLSGSRFDQIQTALQLVVRLIEQGRLETADRRIETALDAAEQAVARARVCVANAAEAIPDHQDGADGATAMQLRRSYESGYLARAHGRLANPFEDPYGADWAGRRAHAAAWNHGRAGWEATHRIGQAESDAPSGPPVQEVQLTASREIRDHRRRILEHQEKIAAERRAQAAQSTEPQLTMRLIGEVRRPEPSPPKRRRPRTNKPVQPELGEP